MSECGESGGSSGDSTCLITNSLIKVISLNSSSNQGRFGSSGFSFGKCLDSSCAKFLNVYNILNDYAIETNSNLANVSMSNFVRFDFDVNLACIWMETDNLFTFTSCCFYETNNVVFSAHGRECELVLCLSDDETIPATKTTLTLFEFPIDLSCKTNIETSLNHNLHIHIRLSSLFFAIIFS